jgi:Tol biopolymer transport system component
VFSVSSVGALTYQTGTWELESQLSWYDRAGRQLATLGEPGDQMSVELSPDGTRVLVSMFDSVTRGRDLWIYDVKRGSRTRFTFDPAVENMGAWSADGSRVAFNSSRRRGSFDLYEKASNGAGVEELLVEDDQPKEPYGWSNDGQVLAYSAASNRTSQDIWTVELTGDRTREVFLQTPFLEGRPRLSPDGRWLAYSSNESGRSEIYVTTFPTRSGKWQVSTGGGNFPRWRRDGQEMYYVSSDNALMAASVRVNNGALEVGTVQRLFEIRARQTGARAGQEGYAYDVSADGQRFLVNTLVRELSTQPITILLNWPALVRR